MSVIATSGCVCMCPMGDKPGRLMGTAQQSVLVEGKPACIITDMVFEAPTGVFGVCKATFPLVKPCTPAIASWIPSSPTVLVGGMPVLTVGCTGICTTGPGAVTVVNSPQMKVLAG